MSYQNVLNAKTQKKNIPKSDSIVYTNLEILANGVGRRKSATAQVKFIQGTGNFIINKKPGFMYMHQNSSRLLILQAPLDFLQLQKNIILL